MFASIRILALGVAVLAMAGCSQADTPVSDYGKVSGPYTAGNLSVFFIQGEASSMPGGLLTLAEALELGKIEVIETGSVGELAARNLGDEPIFIQAGDIVKGGRQDRTLQYDLILEPGEEAVPLKSFCVEQGRWSARSGEQADRFAVSLSTLSSKDLKLAAKLRSSQTEVWEQVAEMQSDLSQSLGAPVADDMSPTSLQLALENDALQQDIAEGVAEFTADMKRLRDVVGFAFAVNGEINSADIYGSSDLFAKMWPKLIKAALTEAVSNDDGSGSHREITSEEIAVWLSSADSGEATIQRLEDRMQLKVIESGNDVVFDFGSTVGSGGLIHKNVIHK